MLKKKKSNPETFSQVHFSLKVLVSGSSLYPEKEMDSAPKGTGRGTATWPKGQLSALVEVPAANSKQGPRRPAWTWCGGLRRILQPRAGVRGGGGRKGAQLNETAP